MNTWRTAGAALAISGLFGCYGAQVGQHQDGLIEEEGGVCESDETTLFAGQRIDAGSVSVASNGADLLVTIAGANGWQISEYHVYAGTGPVPVNGAGAAAPGQFPYHGSFDPTTASTTVHIPLADVGAECGDSLNIAVHTVVKRYVDGVVVDTQTGWGFGPNRYRRAWGWWFTTEVCCETDTCVRSKGPWREIPALWPISELEIGGATYDAYALVDILYTGPEDASIDLAHQYIAARINEANGAFVDPQTAADLAAAAAALDATVDADGLLPYGVLAGDPDLDTLSALRNALWTYNMGLRDTPLCSPEWLAPAPLPAR